MFKPKATRWQSAIVLWFVVFSHSPCFYYADDLRSNAAALHKALINALAYTHTSICSVLIVFRIFAFFVSPLNFADSQLLHTFLCLCVLICVCVCVLTKFPTQHVYLRIGFFVAIVKSVVAYIVYFCYSFF